jgi:membrane protease YdiL (CAAX protease family)
MRAHRSIKEMIRLVPMGIILGVFPALGEEIGWRGLALLKLQEKHTAVTASVIIRITWGL